MHPISPAAAWLDFRRTMKVTTMHPWPCIALLLAALSLQPGLAGLQTRASSQAVHGPAARAVLVRSYTLPARHSGLSAAHSLRLSSLYRSQTTHSSRFQTPRRYTTRRYKSRSHTPRLRKPRASNSPGSASSGVTRDAHGRIKRSAAAKDAFKRQQPCPSSGKSSGPCPGYVIDHIKPLECGGADSPANMQWQTIADGKAKDKTERNCR